jgi:hypothetical protein
MYTCIIARTNIDTSKKMVIDNFNSVYHDTIENTITAIEESLDIYDYTIVYLDSKRAVMVYRPKLFVESHIYITQQ